MDHLPEQMLCAVAAVTVSLALGGNACASEVSFQFNFSNGTQSASAEFTFAAEELSQATLTISLTNTMTSNDGPNWLTGVFFDLGGTPTLDYASILGDMITLEGTEQTEYLEAGPDHFWAMRDDFSGEVPIGDQQYGLGAAGLDIFGPGDILMPGDGPLPQPAGTDGGILADIVGLAVPEGHDGRPFVLGTLDIIFMLPVGFNLEDADVTNLAFLFGTGFEEVVLIPLPLPIAMAGAGLMIVVCFRRRLVALAGT